MSTDATCIRRRESAVKGAHVSGMEAYDKLCAEAEADYEGFWARLARELVTWKTPFTKVLDESERAVLQVVRGRHAERLVQLPGPQRRARPGRQDRDHLRGRRRQGHQGQLQRRCWRRPASSPTR